MKLYRVVLPYACYGLLVKNDRVMVAPPIAKWMVGKTLHVVTNWIVHKCGSIEEISCEPEKTP